MYTSVQNVYEDMENYKSEITPTGCKSIYIAVNIGYS